MGAEIAHRKPQRSSRPKQRFSLNPAVLANKDLCLDALISLTILCPAFEMLAEQNVASTSKLMATALVPFIMAHSHGNAQLVHGARINILHPSQCAMIFFGICSFEIAFP